MKEDTLPKLLMRNYERWGDKQVAMRKKDLGMWNEYTWQDCYEKVKYFSLGLTSLGLEYGDKIAILGDNDPEWVWTAFAAQAVGGIPTGIYPDMAPPEVKYITEHSDAKFVVARDQEAVDKVIEVKDELPRIERLIYWDPQGLISYREPYLMSFEEVLELGIKYEQTHQGSFEQKITQGSGNDFCFLYYTSGTTGLPKASLRTHWSMISATEALYKSSPTCEKDDQVSFVTSAWFGEAVTGSVPHLATGLTLNFPERPDTVQEDTREIAPEVLVYGPRQWEDIISTIKLKISDAAFVKRLAFTLLLPVGYKSAELRLNNERSNPFWELLHKTADLVIFRPIRDWFGLSNLWFPLTGSAFLSPDTYRFLMAMGIGLRQAYGGTEAGFSTGHPMDDLMPESVGPPLQGVDIRISDTREILHRSNGLFTGYYKDAESTDKALSAGWFYSGDAGHVNEDGHLIYHDRIPDLGELANGSKYAPVYIESRLKFSPFVREVIVVGGKEREYVSAIINIDFDNVAKWAESCRITYTTFVDLSQKEEVSEIVLADINKLNKLLPETSRVKKFVLLHKEFDPDEQELTRTRKLRRKHMEGQYAELISAIYAGKDEAPIIADVKYRDGRTGTVSTSLKIRSVGEG